MAEPAGRAYYDRNAPRGKKHNAAPIYLARRHVDVLPAVLRTRANYQDKPTEETALAA